MHNTRLIADDIVYVGASDRRLALFENVYPIPRGVSYNSYLVLDEKTVLMDTVDFSVSRQFFENLSYALGDRKLDYVVVNHMEPDHCASLEEVVLRYPDVKVVGNAKTVQMIKQFFSFDIDSRAIIVKEGDTISSGKHEYTFVMAPMVHWPEVMVTYDKTAKVLFSADAFGTFGALSGSLFDDEVDFDKEWLDDARRYYINIVGKYGMQTTSLLKKASALEIKTICPLHGPVWRSNLGYYIEKHALWAGYQPEEKGALIIYSSIYGNTESAMSALASMIAEKGVRNIHMYDASSIDVSYLVAECFRYSTIVFASPTYNAEIFPKMEALLLELKAHSFQNRDVAVIENGTWALSAGKKMTELLSQMKNIRIIADNLSIKSSLKECQIDQLEAIASAVADSVRS
ncbi:MAG: FprA family A-type flavoprotein [Candidatus Ornithospirochaeta sp.]|nr:FprA family A-type flavoprotein [Candidatus Ornithospirochaeta sp.]